MEGSGNSRGRSMSRPYTYVSTNPAQNERFGIYGISKGEKCITHSYGYPPRRQIYFGIYDLKYAAKSGRIPKADAFLGTALNMKPVMNIFDRSITTGAKYDRKAKRQGKAYRFLFVRADGVQLEKITQIVEANHIVPKIDSHEFDLSQINDALQLVAGGHINGKVIVRFP